jgi:hypothetical protein
MLRVCLMWINIKFKWYLIASTWLSFLKIAQDQPATSAQVPPLTLAEVKPDASMHSPFISHHTHSYSHRKREGK